MPHFTDTVSLKRPKRTKEDMKNDMAIGFDENEDRFPFGTAIRFEEPEIENIEMLQDIDVDVEVVIYAKGKVVEVESRATEKKKRRNVRIQITDIAIHDANDAEEAFNEGGKK